MVTTLGLIFLDLEETMPGIAGAVIDEALASRHEGCPAEDLATIDQLAASLGPLPEWGPTELRERFPRISKRLDSEPGDRQSERT